MITVNEHLDFAEMASRRSFGALREAAGNLEDSINALPADDKLVTELSTLRSQLWSLEDFARSVNTRIAIIHAERHRHE